MTGSTSTARLRSFLRLSLVLLALAGTSADAAALGDPDKGRALFRVCAACHTIQPGRHMTGPSLAEIWERKAASVDGFRRYSDALKHSGLTWDAATLDKWLEDPKALVPLNRMTFRGMADARQRSDLIAYLRQVSEWRKVGSNKAAEAAPDRAMRGGNLLDLKTLPANNRVTAIAHCGDTYTVSTESGETHPFWEFNLRFKTDTSDLGPPAGKPVIIPASMRGDRAFVVFADPAEISPFIKKSC